jgi:hypothetical protein
MKWIKVGILAPRPGDDILFTDGKQVFKGWLETHEFGEDLVFCNDSCQLQSDLWPENITHWRPLPELPTEFNIFTEAELEKETFWWENWGRPKNEVD